MLNELYGRGGRVRLRERDAAGYVHVDDGVIVVAHERGQRPAAPACDDVMMRLAAAWEETGFLVPERVAADASTRVVGYQFAADPPTLSVDPDRGALMQDSLAWLLEVPWVDIELLRGVVGVWIWGALLKRELLSIPHAVFKFMDQYEGRVVPWWPSARREVRVMQWLVPAMRADLGAPAARMVFSTDAEGDNFYDHGGFGVVAKLVEADLAEELILAGTRPGHTVARLDGRVSHLNRQDREIAGRIPVSKVPRRLLEAEASSWTALDAGRWERPDHITLGEGRAALRALTRVAACPGSHGHLIANLEDNETLSAAMAKGRSAAPALNQLLRRRAGLCLATGIGYLLPWVDTKHQAADWLSRYRGRW